MSFKLKSGDDSVLTSFITEIDGTWFGVAYANRKIVATTLETTRDGAEKSLIKSLPIHAEYKMETEGSQFAKKFILMLRDVNNGNEENKDFTLATEYFSVPTAKVLNAAALVPIGFVSTYGNLANVASTSPRVVGRIMARNPIYPIVPCHRIVGSDFSLVGYGGRKTSAARQAKLAKLFNERRGFTSEKRLSTDGGKLIVYPVEYVLRKAEKELQFSHRQKKLE
jgi:O-6-methylguanine DNA methyltransferase